MRLCAGQYELLPSDVYWLSIFMVPTQELAVHAWLFISAFLMVIRSVTASTTVV